ncbi:MAG: TAT-variant-translocated molybdopterin oxidoreductase [Bacteroidia bacterium]
MANENKYWKGLTQLQNSEKFAEQQRNEFAEYIPVEEFISDKSSLEASSTNRRDFLKFLGFSTVAATLAACEAPVTKAIPYVNRPEEITPGVANFYASTFFDGYDYAAVLVKTREGRPIKIEGNEMSKITMGGTNARVQASVLSLYDSSRVKGPKAKSGNGFADKSWGDIDNAVKAKLEQSKGIAILSSTIISPSTRQAITEFKAKYPSTRHVSYDAVSYSGMLKANLSTFGVAMIPTYNFDKADVIVSLGADFLVNWVSPIEHARQYSKSRKVSKDKKEMSKHFQFESILSVTGANADERIPVKPSQLGQVALGLLAGVGGNVSAPSVLSKEVAKVADALKAANGKALVVCGSNDAAVQLVVNQINQKIGAYGNTINTEVPDYTHQGDDAAFKKLVDDINAGSVDTVIFYNTNPVLTAPAGLGWDAAMNKLSCRISFAQVLDETAAKCDFVCPDHHYLESWNDHNPRKGHYSLQQPTIRPLFSTRHAQESLLTWAGNTSDYHTYIQKYWSNNLFSRQNAFGDFTSFWNKTVHDGLADLAAAPVAVVADAKETVKKEELKKEEKPVADSLAAAAPVAVVSADGITFSGGTITLDEAVSQINAAKGGKYELVIYQKTGIGNGNQSNNPWLQELPDPISKITWDNYITMHPMDVKEKKLFGMEDGKDVMVRFDQMEDALDMVTVKANGYSVTLPVWAQPGQARGTIGIALGYGRKGFNEVIDNTGKNIYPAIGMTASGTMSYDVYSVDISDATGEKYMIAATQTHHTLMGRNEDIIRETTLTAYKKDDRAGNPALEMHTYKGTQAVEDVNLWNDFDRPNHKWALAIDLNSCIGCGACVISCNAENNVSVVGRDEIRRSREMHWMRIDRYFSSDTVKEEAEGKGEMGTMEMYRMMENPAFDNPKVVFQPVMCQHCNHAPCETVCPVLATNHSNEGLNQMTYNRCVGTRYCANNCPYKVRRFNWFNYVEYHRFADINPAQDALGRMVLNPDVTVRARGVMEKCSMCVQRIQAGKLEAKKEGRTLVDGEIKTACSQACPTNAITFGDINNPESEVAKMEKDGRKYELLEVVGVKPSVFYMTKVWNREDEKAHV